MTDDPIQLGLSPCLSRACVRIVFQELVRVPSVQADLIEAEPLLSEFMNVALLPRMKQVGMASARLDAMGNLIAETGARRPGRSLMLVTHAMNQPPSRCWEFTFEVQPLRTQNCPRRPSADPL
jgi:hypothetical protein